MKISSYNEWDKIRTVVVGSATCANWPTTDSVFSQESSKTTWHETSVPQGPVPDWIVEQTNQELDLLANTLTQLGAQVLRPQDIDFVKLDGMYNYCPRDRLLIAGNTVVDPAMMYPCRDIELDAYRNVVDAAEHYLHMPRHEGMILDAANICRLNDTWLYLESASGNQKAYNWLCEQFPDVNIEHCNFYSGVHIDSTIVPLREGLVLLNGTRVNDDNCPQAFKTWQKIYVDDVVAQDFYQYPYASKWIALNMLVVDPNTIIIDAAQTKLIQLLEKHHFVVIPLTLTHSRTLGGGFHCVTLDLERS